MPEVTCPACHTRQGIDPEATGYSCTSCGADWDFVTCSSCGSRFHAAPDAPGWRCPTCGTENARPHARLGAPAPGAELPLSPNRMMVFGAIGIVVIALATWALARGDDDGTAAPAPTTTSSVAAGSAREALCTHLVDIQSLRFEALGEVAVTLREDATAIEAEGDPTLARQVKRLSREVAALQAAFDTPDIEDDQAATDALLVALEPIPCT